MEKTSVEVAQMLFDKIEQYSKKGQTITKICLEQSLYNKLNYPRSGFQIDVKEITVPVSFYPDLCDSYLYFKDSRGNESPAVKIKW